LETSIDCHKCVNYCIEDIEGSDWAVGVCYLSHDLDPESCKDFEEYDEERTSKTE